MFADTGAKTPPLMGTTTPAAVADAVRRAIVDDKVEITVAPLLDRVAAHAGMVSPRGLGPSPRAAASASAPPPPSPRPTRKTSVEPTLLLSPPPRKVRLMSTQSDSFGAKSTLEVGGRAYEIFRLDALQERFDVARLPYSIKVLLENVLRLEDGVSVSKADVEAIASWDAAAEPSVEIPFQPARVLMQDFTGVPAVVDLAAMRDAMAEIGGDADRDQPAGRRRPGDRPLGAGRRLRQRARLRRQRRARLRTQPRALLVPQVGPGQLRQLPRRPARDRDLPPGQPRVPLAGRLLERERRHAAGLPRHAGRDRLAHDDGQRARRARLGRRRDRGRGGDAGPADLDAAAAGRRLQALRRTAGGGDRDRPRPHRHRDAAGARRRLQVRRVLRAGAADAGARRPGDARQHVAGVRLDLRDLPGRRRDAPLHGPDRAADRDDRAGRRLRAGAGDVPRRVDARSGLLRPAGARPRRRRAVDRRAETPAGPGAARRGEGVVPRGDGGIRPRRGREARQRARRGDRRVLPGLRPARRGPRRRARQAAARGLRLAGGDGGEAALRRRDRGDASTARPSSSTTAAS